MDEDDIPTLLEVEANSSEASSTVPLTIICGFLGAGKSTLVRRILSERHGYRIAVIMNDFGDTADIEAKTINVSSPDNPAAEQSEEILELANGCLCCSIKDTGVAAIEKLMQRKGAFDHILLETTGLADPGPIASMFWQNEEYSMGLGRDIHLDGVVCMVDAVFGLQQMEEDNSSDGIGESLRQIACADVVLLNKTDLASPDQTATIENMIGGVNPAAIIHRTIQGNIDLKHIMNINAYASRPIKLVASREVTNTTDNDTHECDSKGCEHDHNVPQHHYEIRGISSMQVSCPTLTTKSLQELDEWIRTLLWENRLPEDADGAPSVNILRCKGIFSIDTGETYVLQGVRNLYEISTLDKSEMGLPDEGKLVFIGKGLDSRARSSLGHVLTKNN